MNARALFRGCRRRRRLAIYNVLAIDHFVAARQIRARPPGRKIGQNIASHPIPIGR